MDWLVQLLDLPAKFLSTGRGGGVIQDSASNAPRSALLAARERVTGGSINARGGTGQQVVYATSQTHSSLEKAMMISGLGREDLRFVPVDEDFAMRPEALAAMIAADRAAERAHHGLRLGRHDLVQRHRPAAGHWRHLPGGKGCGCMWMRPWRAQQRSARSSVSFTKGWSWPTATASNPHKWMFTNFDCDAFFVADRQALRPLFSCWKFCIKIRTKRFLHAGTGKVG